MAAGAGSYDRSITVFSPDGHLLQVEYAQEAVNKGFAVVGVRGESIVVLGAEMKALTQLQQGRTTKKICPVDEHVMVAFAGLTGDARILLQRAMIECQSHRLTVEDEVSIEYITQFIASLKQKYTNINGRRPFGLSCLVAGTDSDGSPHLYQTEPSGVYYECKAAVTGRGAKDVRTFLEKTYPSNIIKDDDEAINLCIRSFIQILQTQPDQIDIAIVRPFQSIEILTKEDVEKLCSLVKREP